MKRLLLSLVAALMISGCGDDPTPPPGPGPTPPPVPVPIPPPAPTDVKFILKGAHIVISGHVAADSAVSAREIEAALKSLITTSEL